MLDEKWIQVLGNSNEIDDGERERVMTVHFHSCIYIYGQRIYMVDVCVSV